MINKIPKNFTYNNSTENLFLFYQRISELLFDYSPDSYKTSTHNSHTLCAEAYNIYSFLKSDGSLFKFYEQYIPDIISELISSIRKDSAAKTHCYAQGYSISLIHAAKTIEKFCRG